jgi:protein-tyrosine phosphatase
MFHIIDNIYLSNLRDAENYQLINDNNIKIVIRLSEDENKSPYMNNIEFYNFEIEDNLLYKKELIDISEIVYQLIEDNKDKNILIHCNEGQSRSVSVIIYYLIRKYEYDYFKSYDLIKNIKVDAKPNMAFQKVLMSYSDYILGI